jgi:hypothetical protein
MAKGKRFDRQLEVARQLRADVLVGSGGVIHITPNLMQEIITGLTAEEAWEWLLKRQEGKRAEFAQRAEKLFQEISRSSFLGPVVATEIFRATAAQRPRSTVYSRELNLALSLHVLKTNSPTKTARRAIELGLEPKDQLTALVRRIKNLRKGGLK